MPLYEYECEKGHSYEKQESFGAPAEQPCERSRCKATAHRIFFPPQIHFNGPGFHRSSPEPPPSKSESKSSDGPSDSKKISKKIEEETIPLNREGKRS